MNIYNSVRKVPNEALKTIKAGRLSGMNDINPMWRIKAMTETFGPCGFGWKYEITKQWLETFGSEVKCFCNLNLYYKKDGEWSEAIPGTGGSSFVTMERNGAYVSDEAHKMALTDALSVAMKALGVGASIYFEKDADYGTKYEVHKAPISTSAQPRDSGVSDSLIAKINACQSIDELKAMWSKASGELQNNPTFVKEFTRRKNEITSTNKK